VTNDKRASHILEGGIEVIFFLVIWTDHFVQPSFGAVDWAAGAYTPPRLLICPSKQGAPISPKPASRIKGRGAHYG
jgi:hypothetical protein